MKRRLFALLPALALMLTCLTGCGGNAADAFYDLADEITQIQDAEVELILPYHGAELQVTGFISRTNETADLTFTLSGTDGADGTWTELRIDENQMWLNVDQLAKGTLRFELPTLYREDILDLQQEQLAPWVNYTWEGDFWDGIPEWEELLTRLWQDSRPDLEQYIKADGTEYTLTLKGEGLEQAAANLSVRLAEQTDAFRDSFIQTVSRQNGLVMATQLEPGLLFDSDWQELTEASESTEEPLESVRVTLAQTEDSDTVSLSVNDGPAVRLTITPTAPKTVTAPEDVMEFRAYLESVYYLITFSDQYVGDVLDGVSVDDIAVHPVEEEGIDYLSPLAIGAVPGYDDLATVQFATAGGSFSTVPILTGYSENEVASVNDDGVQVLELSLYSSAWTLQVYSESTDQPLAEYLSEAGYGYYNAYINVTGCQLVQDLSDIILSADGTAAAQGFSYREHEYAPAFARLLIVNRQPDGTGYTVLDLELNLEKLTDAERDMVGHLFACLGLEAPISLEA